MFGIPGTKGKRCAKHKLEGDVDLVNKACGVDGCLVQPSFAQPGGKPKRCASHRKDGDVDVRTTRCSTPMCLAIENIQERGYITHVNPETGEKNMCSSCYIRMFPELNTRVTVRIEQFILAEIQRQIPELEPYFLVWDCKLPHQNCNSNKPDMAWGVNDTLIHVEIDEKGEDHEDDTERIVAIHAASNLSNHVLIRFNPDKSSDGDKSCLKKTKLRNGDKAYKRDISEWDRRIPVLIENVREAFNQAMSGEGVSTGKRKLFF